MRIFKNCLEMLGEVERELFEMGIETHPNTMQNIKVMGNADYVTKELIGYSYMLGTWSDKDRMFDFYNHSDLKETGLAYCQQEFLGRVNPIKELNPGVSWVCRIKLWSTLLNKENKFDYTYHDRLRPQLKPIISELKKNPGSRQTILSIYDSNLDIAGMGGVARIPCSMYYQVLCRLENNIKTLSLIYTMRSCDFYNHFPVDVYLALMMLEFLAQEVEAIPVRFIHFMGSLHAYKKDWEMKKIF